jgi:predicted RNA-binding Zn ribbon-like protein
VPALPVLAATVRLDENGAIHTEPAGTGWRKVASLALTECFEAQQADAWRRLKICRNERCEAVFFDRSKNNSAV